MTFNANDWEERVRAQLASKISRAKAVKAIHEEIGEEPRNDIRQSMFTILKAIWTDIDTEERTQAILDAKAPLIEEPKIGRRWLTCLIFLLAGLFGGAMMFGNWSQPQFQPTSTQESVRDRQ